VTSVGAATIPPRFGPRRVVNGATIASVPSKAAACALSAAWTFS